MPSAPDGGACEVQVDPSGDVVAPERDPRKTALVMIDLQKGVQGALETTA